MSVTPIIPLTVEPEAEVLLAELGLHAELEQMLEHAIVHILRHRRQIERRVEV